MGPGDYALGEIMQNLIQIINGELPAGIDGNFNICDVRDLATAMISAVDKGRCGECYILANDVIPFKDFCKLVTQESGGKKVKFFIPPAVANIAGHVMEAIAKKKGEKPVLTTFNVYNLTRNNRFDCTKAREELGYTTRSYEETIHDMVEWLIAEGFIQKEA
jgi:dihydroflavonol-4-reductase